MTKKPMSLDAQAAAVVAEGEAVQAEVKKTTKPKSIFRTPDGRVMNLQHVGKMEQEVLRYVHGEEMQENVRGLPNVKGTVSTFKLARVTEFDPANPLPEPLMPGPKSPLCKQCGLFDCNGRNPFMQPVGAEQPVVTVLVESPTGEDDINGTLRLEKSSIMSIIKQVAAKKEVSFKPEQVRWLLLTRCYSRSGKLTNFKIKGNWCRWHVVDDLNRHRPKLIIAVGSPALGSLSHKSNAQDWGGKLLTYRGWPDDWLMNEKYALPQFDPLDPTKKTTGHPVFGPVPKWRLPLYPIQTPRQILGSQNPLLKERWAGQIEEALKLAESGVKPKLYRRPWYEFTEDVDRIEEVLDELIAVPGLLLSYDTETTGLRPWAATARVVSIMFRWCDPQTGNARSIGFPWQVEHSPVYKAIPRLRWKLWQVLCGTEAGQRVLVGHNITFDVLYTYATFWRHYQEDWLTGWQDRERNLERDAHLCALTRAAVFDTWHMAYTTAQRRESLGLELLAYAYVPDLAGYEEDMTLLISLLGDSMNPAENKGGHYLNCPRDKWKTHLEPYVMGDVEVTYRAHDKLTEKLASTKTYKIPLAAPNRPGYFRWFEPPRRDWVYSKIMSPAARVLMTMMGRGMFVDGAEVDRLQSALPQQIVKLREAFTGEDPRIRIWMGQKNDEARSEAMKKGQVVGADDVLWHLDLENKEHLRELLFDTLGIVPPRLTKGGKKLYGDETDEQLDRMVAEFLKWKPKATEDEVIEHVVATRKKFAAIDKFTLNALAVDHPSLRKMLEYRKTFKLYTTYVRPLRNYTDTLVDKKVRTKDPHLCYDNCIHASFLLTGTRGGRLSCRDPNLQQLPRDGEVKSMFVSRFGERGCMYQADLSQIELRLMAATCGDPTMVKAYFDGIDLHSLTASRIYNVPYEHFTKQYMKWLQDKKRDKEAKTLELNRVTAKTVNFLTGYGGGAFGLQNVLAAKAIFKDIEECEDIIAAFFESYPALRSMLQLYKGFIQQKGCAVSVFGRVRVFEEVWGGDEEAKAKALRAGCNHLIQSTASDMMLIALFTIENEMRRAGLESILVSTVHDSLLTDAIRSELPQVHEIVTSVLNNFDVVLPLVLGDDFDTSWMLVPFTGDCEVGADYLNVHKIPEKDIDWDKLLAPSA